MKNHKTPIDKENEEQMSKKLGHDDVISLYVIILFLMFMIAIISMWQSRRIDLLREDINALKNSPSLATEHLRSAKP